MVKPREGWARIYNRQIDVLILCTANQNRSPMAEVLLRRRLEALGLPVRVSSAGLYPSGAPAMADTAAVMAARGYDLQEHLSRQVTPELLDDADLVIGMTREHVREIAVLDTLALRKTFTLKELVRSGLAVGPRRRGESADAWLERVGAGRRREALLGVGFDPEYDVEDPVGGPRADYEATADELEGLLDRLLGLLWPDGTAHDQERSA